jgi:hypothetical protein
MTNGMSSDASVRTGRKLVRGGLLAGKIDPATLVWLLPCAIAVAYVGVFLARLPHSIWELNWNSDYASGFTVPQAVAQTGTGGHTVLGTYPLYLPLWFGLLTAKLPLHRELWELGPTALFVFTALTIGWSLAQFASRYASALAVLLVLTASPAALSVFMAAVAHNSVYPCTALLGAYLVWLARSDSLGAARTALVTMLVAAGIGVCLASDILLVSTGLAPFVLTALVLAARRDRLCTRVALQAGATALLALPIAWLTVTIMSGLGYATNPAHFEPAPLSGLPVRLQVMWSGLENLFNGTPGVGPSDDTAQHILAAACDVIAGLALLALLVAGVRRVVAFLRPGGRARPDAVSTPQLAEVSHVTFWVLSGLIACGASAFSTFLYLPHEAFYVTILFSVAAVLPLLARRSSLVRWLLPLGASIFFSASLVGLTRANAVGGGGRVALASYEADVVKLARTYHATTGYAGYWDASSLTWSSREHVLVRPVFPCYSPHSSALCVFSQETVASWYKPQARRTFLLVEAGEYYVGFLPGGLGKPLAGYAFGPMRMYIYPYDLAARLGPSDSPNL